MPRTTPVEFKDQLQAAMEAAGIDRKQLAVRLLASTQEVGYWLRGDRVPDDDRQREILAACERSAPTTSLLIAGFRAEVQTLIDKLDADLQTVARQRPAVSDADAARYEAALDAGAPGRAEAQPAPRRVRRPR